MKTTAEGLLLWEQRIKERLQNKMTVDEWCIKNGTSKHQYYYWNRRIRENQQKPGGGAEFVDISQVLSHSDSTRQNGVPSSEFQIFINGIRVTVPSDFNPVALAGLMKVLHAL